MMVVRIIKNGCDINGNMKNKIIAYREIGDETKDELSVCLHLTKNEMKRLFNGKYTEKTFTLTTFDTLEEIRQALRIHAQKTGEKVITIYE